MDICILSKKWLDKNTRIIRQARVLAARGHRVTVLAIALPEPNVLKSMQDTEFVILNPAPLKGWVVRLKQWFPQNVRDALSKMRKTPAAAPRIFFSALHDNGAGDTAWLVLLAALAAMAFPVLVVTAILAWPLLWLAYGALRLQTPGGVGCGVKASDVWRFRYDRVLRALLSPYLGELRAAAFNKMAVSALSGRQFDVVQAHDSHALPAARKVARLADARLVFDAVEIYSDLSGMRFRRRPAFLSRWVNKKIARIIGEDADRLICFGDSGADWYAAEFGIPRPDVIWNCREYWKREPDDRLRKDAGLSHKERIIVVLNTMYEGQGLEQAVEALSMLDDDIHLCTIGWETKPGYMAACQKLAEKYGVADRLHYMQRRPTWDLVPYASGGDIALMARQKNGTLNNLYSMPNRIFEAVMARLPLACSNLPDIRNLVKALDIGMAFDETDPKDIARVIEAMLDQKKLVHYTAQIEQAARLLCWENEGRSYVDIIEAVGGDDRDMTRDFYDDACKVKPAYLRRLRQSKFRSVSAGTDDNLEKEAA